MTPLNQKESGAYYTPEDVARSLLCWAARSERDRLLDPSCGDGRFIAGHKNSVGIEQDAAAARAAVERAPWALVHEGDFFTWASNTTERFDCAAGNPPFIRYQTFKGSARARALTLCAQAGARFTGLASSWAPFLVATATLLAPGGRMAFVVPAEIGHAPYAAPVLEYLTRNFGTVHVIAVQQKLFPELSEDCWLLFADSYGAETGEIRFSALTSFAFMAEPPRHFLRVPMSEWRSDWNRRLRPFLISHEVREIYRELLSNGQTTRLGELANVGIGYVTGANDFFHFRPSTAHQWGIKDNWLHPTVRKGSSLPQGRLTASTVRQWREEDEQMLLLRIPKCAEIPKEVGRYLNSEAGYIAREAYKCRVREPWYAVPDVQIPDFFLSYMSGLEASLVRNDAGCTCTNSVHSVRLKSKAAAARLVGAWGSDFTRLSTEIEGHPLGGGMLKLEPREASQIAIAEPSLMKRLPAPAIAGALSTLREWRHHAPAN